VTTLGIKAEPTEGKLGDAEINARHRDLVKISAVNLGRLAAVIAHGERGQLLSKEFAQIVTREVQQGRLNLSGNGNLRVALGL
jgi:hydroxymethylglutaryl-CoA reductase